MSSPNFPLSALEQRIIQGLLREDPQSFREWLGTLAEAEQRYARSRIQFIRRIIENKNANVLYIPIDHLKTPTGWLTIISSVVDEVEALQRICPEINAELLAALMAALTRQDIRQDASLHTLYMKIRERQEWKACYFALWHAANDAILRWTIDYLALNNNLNSS